ncbi:MAG TPA: helix-turn-helix transcriptional regulator [Trebonia sp.]|jgi:transcriptional regulator with XRE-family HTH domain
MSDALFWQTERARSVRERRDVGAAIRLARENRGWRLADVAARTGYSVSTISRLETSRRRPADLEQVRRIAGAVGIPMEILGELLGVSPPAGATVVGTAEFLAEESDVRRRELLTAAGIAVPAVLLAGMDDALAIMPKPSAPVTSAAVSTRLARLRELYDSGSLARVIGALPDLLASADSMTRTSPGPARYALLAACYDLATEALHKTGHEPASRITADRAMTSAGLSGSAAAVAYAARSLSIVFRHQGRQQLAERVTFRAAEELDKTGLRTRMQAAAYAQTLCTCAYSAAQAGNREQALDMIAEAGRAADRNPGQPLPGYAIAVTPAHVTLYEIGVHWSLGDAGAALHAARDLRPGQLPTAERRGRLHTDLARAWWRWGKPEQTARSLIAAYRESPAEVTTRPAMRRITDDLKARYPKLPDVAELTRLAAGGR